MAKRTILMLSAKRCGSTAVFKMFQNHRDVGVCYYDKNTDNWEPNFWNLLGINRKYSSEFKALY